LKRKSQVLGPKTAVLGRSLQILRRKDLERLKDGLPNAKRRALNGEFMKTIVLVLGLLISSSVPAHAQSLQTLSPPMRKLIETLLLPQTQECIGKLGARLSPSADNVVITERAGATEYLIYMTEHWRGPEDGPRSQEKILKIEVVPQVTRGGAVYHVTCSYKDAE
jgi:hypothetical protein